MTGVDRAQAFVLAHLDLAKGRVGLAGGAGGAEMEAGVTNLPVPTRWRDALFGAVKGHRGEVALMICTKDEAGEIEFSVGVLIPSEAFMLALIGRTEEPCRVRVYDVEETPP